MSTSSVATLPDPQEMGSVFRKEDWPPTFLILAFAGFSLSLNLWAKLTWDMPVTQMLVMASACFGMAVFFARVYAAPAVREVALYLCLWFLFPLFMTQLSFIAIAANFALQDHLFLSADAALGFHWDQWLHFSNNHPEMLKIQGIAYSSYSLQPILTLPLLALRAPRGRNGEFLTSILLALFCTIIISMLLPTLGPADMFGKPADQNSFIHALRAGFRGPYHSAGIISFPSFHVAMALLYAAAHRGNPLFWPFLALNAVMITATPILGDHYLCDLIAGATIAIGSFLVARRVYRQLGTVRPAQ